MQFQNILPTPTPRSLPARGRARSGRVRLLSPGVTSSGLSSCAGASTWALNPQGGGDGRRSQDSLLSRVPLRSREAARSQPRSLSGRGGAGSGMGAALACLLGRRGLFLVCPVSREGTQVFPKLTRPQRHGRPARSLSVLGPVGAEQHPSLDGRSTPSVTATAVPRPVPVSPQGRITGARTHRSREGTWLRGPPCFSRPFFGPHERASPQGLGTLATSCSAGATGGHGGWCACPSQGCIVLSLVQGTPSQSLPQPPGVWFNPQLLVATELEGGSGMLSPGMGQLQRPPSVGL